MSVIGFLVVAASVVILEASRVVVVVIEVDLWLVANSEVVAGVIVVHVGKSMVLLDVFDLFIIPIQLYMNP